ncbi:MAG: Asp-tRNA(Asn)/Glu-tRNA(Gln) amidotransferase subunit GatB [Nitrososphaerales archaeon]|jgi:aspartyl-tRNA(Asn)/glutamyl-tRNA(Gln) amidotransferase subunit B
MSVDGEREEGRRRGAGAASAGSVKIGLEIHCQLTALKTKLFCGCSSDYRGREPNEMVCPVCFGVPGTLPVLNERAVEYAVRIANALACEVAPVTTFYRKNYFYPDLPKNFQISQYDKAGGVPIASSGRLTAAGGKLVRIRRIQLEEDPGKLTYEGTIDRSSYSMVDYNRAGIALVEIVTEPDLGSAREAKLFLEKLRETVEVLGVSDGELEGAMRCDANVSVGGGARVEVKNISSFKEVEKALSYEILRQGTFSGAGAVNETRHWDERRSITISLRLKEEEQDYRYFPEPDLRPVALGRDFLERVRRETPEVPEVRAERYVRELGLSPQSAGEISRDEALSRFFELAAAASGRPAEVANWIAGEFREEHRRALEGPEPRLRPQGLADLLSMVRRGELTRAQARQVFRSMASTGRPPSELAPLRAAQGEKEGGRPLGGGVIGDEGAIEALVDSVFGQDGGAVEEARRNPRAINYLMGRVLGLEPRADPRVVARAIRKRLAA